MAAPRVGAPYDSCEGFAGDRKGRPYDVCRRFAGDRKGRPYGFAGIVGGQSRPPLRKRR